MSNKLILISALFPGILFAQTKPTESVALDWLNLIDSQSYKESWDSTGKLFRSQITKDEWIIAVGTAREAAGDLKSRSLSATKTVSSLPHIPDSDYVVLQYKSVFVNQQATETLTLVKAGNHWDVVGYFIH